IAPVPRDRPARRLHHLLGLLARCRAPVRTRRPLDGRGLRRPLGPAVDRRAPRRPHARSPGRVGCAAYPKESIRSPKNPMRCLIPRASRASVAVDDATTGEIGRGLLVLVCAMQEDTDADAERLAQKTARLRIFPDDQDRMNRSLLDIGGEALVVSQFTLAAETKGNRPGFTRAAAPEEGRRLYEVFGNRLAALGVRTAW